MFDSVTVTVPREDNLLIQNTATGWYLSVLFRDQTAAENGRILENVGVFRDSGMYYVEAVLACRAVGLETELYSALRRTAGRPSTPRERLWEIPAFGTPGSSVRTPVWKASCRELRTARWD